jgi:hypothetical protein
MNVVSESTFLILAAEAIAVLVAVIVFAVVWHMRQDKLDRSAIADFIHNVKRGETGRSEAVQSTLVDSYRFAGEELHEAVSAVITKERDIYRILVAIYQDRDRNRIKSFIETVEALVTVSLGIVPKTNDEAYEQALAVLREEHDQLKLELEATKHTLAGLMNEYTAAFDKEQKNSLEKDKQSTLTQPIAAPEPELEVEVETITDELPPTQLQMLDTLAQLDAALDIGPDTRSEDPEQPEPTTTPQPVENLDNAFLAELIAVDSDLLMENRATGT